MTKHSARKPKVAVIGTGGTISSLGRHSLDYIEYTDFGGPKLDAQELVARVPELAAAADVVPIGHRAIGSTKMTTEDWIELTRLVHRTVAADPSLDGVVITHGTATLEETAYFLNLSLKVACPVVVVGSQRPFNALSSDASLNLLNAVRIAGAETARGLGVLVVLNDEIHAAREVTKGSVFRLDAFRSPDAGPLGFADADGGIVLYRKPTRRHAPDAEFDVDGASALPRVDIAYSYAGADATATRAFLDAGAKGVVLAALAPGLLTPGEKDAVVEARRRGAQVVMSCRAGSGRIIERELLRAEGVVPADSLNPQKARVLLMLALSRTNDPARIQEMFEAY